MARGRTTGCGSVTVCRTSCAACSTVSVFGACNLSGKGVAEVHGITRDTGDGDGEGLTGPGVTVCKRENPKASRATNATSAAASDSSRSAERRWTGGGGTGVDGITLTWSGAGGPGPALEGR